jgi:hypothetical protein
MPTAPKQPQDHQPKADAPFIWTAPDGRKVKFTPYNRLPFSLFDDAREQTELEAIFSFIGYACSDKDREVLRACTIEDVNAAIAEWQNAAGVAPGE